MDAERLKELQECQIMIMEDIHKICEENNIEYYIIGGTALGAVRHRGFIPWDVDIDIAMHRPHYNKFKEVCREKLSSKYSYVDHTVHKDYYPPHALIVLNNSVLTKRNDHLNPRLRSYGIFIDLFPLDNVPNDGRLQGKQAKAIKRIRALKWYRSAVIYPQHSSMKKYAKKLVRLVLLPITMKQLNEKLQKVMKKYNDDESIKNWCSMASGYSYEKQSMPKEIYGKPKLMEFSGRLFYAPENVLEYLTRIYGDYMKLPSEEERQKSMDIFLDASW